MLGHPLRGYVAPAGGPTDVASRRLAEVFFAVYDGARRAGRLRTPVSPPPAPAVAAAWAASPERRAAGFTIDETYLFVLGFQRLQGLVTFEVSGSVVAGVSDHSAYLLDQLERLLDEVLKPGP